MTEDGSPVLAIACGGTGGHFYPGVTLAEHFREQGGKVVLFIGGHHAENQIAYARERNFDAVAAPAIRLPRRPLAALTFPLKFLACIRKNKALLKSHKVDAALVMGSFASVPMGLAAAKLKLPLACHEGNAVLGQANRFLSRYAKVLGLSFPLKIATVTRARQVLVGMPVRQQIIDAAKSSIDKDALAKSLGFNLEKPVLFTFGGSQGARSLNDLMLKLAGESESILKKFQLIHLTGSEENDSYIHAYDSAGITAVVKARDPDIHLLYQISDFIICRAGASTLAELALIGKAPLMIPFPGAKYDHQTANAEFHVNAGAGWLLAEADLSADKVSEILANWQNNQDNEAHRKMAELAKPQATADMIALIQDLLK